MSASKECYYGCELEEGEEVCSTGCCETCCSDGCQGRCSTAMNNMIDRADYQRKLND